MRKTIMAVAIMALALSASAKPDTKEKVGFEGKHPVFVVVNIPGGPQTGFYIDKAQAKALGIPRCSATITNYCWQ